jgi:hypothetical protein
MRALLLALATVSGLAAGAPALAQTLTVTPNFVIDVTGFNGDLNSLANAASNVESLSDARVAAIAYNNVAGTPGYGVILVRGSNVTFKRLDKPNGKPIAVTGLSIPKWMMTWRTQRRAAVVAAAKVSLADAIRTAEASEHNTPAVVAGIARSASDPTTDVHAYMVGILRSGDLHTVAVNSATGSVIENPSALAW